MITKLVEEIAKLDHKYRPAVCYNCSEETDLFVFMDNTVLCRKCRIILLEELKRELEHEKRRVREVSKIRKN